MGKTTRNHKKKLAKLKKKIQVPTDFSTYSQEDLLKKALEEVDVFHYEKAQTFCQEALKREADNVRALEISANLCIETGNIDGAKHCLGRAITVCPENGFTKYFSMAQLIGGKEALQCYMKGIEILNICKTKNIVNSEICDKENSKNESGLQKLSPEKKNISENEDESQILIRKLSNAYCSIAELFMSDLCDEEDAESQCNSNIQNALEADSTNPEAYQCHASLFLIKSDLEEARKSIKKSLSLWLPKYQEIDDGIAEAGSFDPIEICPLSQASRIGCARILIELEEYELASDVLEGLLGEDDEDVYTWYLLGWNLYLQDNKKYEAKSHLQKALELNKISPTNDFQVIEHIKELLKEIGDVAEPPEADVISQENLENMSEMDIP